MLLGICLSKPLVTLDMIFTSHVHFYFSILAYGAFLTINTWLVSFLPISIPYILIRLNLDLTISIKTHFSLSFRFLKHLHPYQLVSGSLSNLLLLPTFIKHTLFFFKVKYIPYFLNKGAKKYKEKSENIPKSQHYTRNTVSLYT